MIDHVLKLAKSAILAGCVASTSLAKAEVVYFPESILEEAVSKVIGVELEKLRLKLETDLAQVRNNQKTAPSSQALAYSVLVNKLNAKISQVEVDIGDLPSRLTKDLLAKYLFSFELNGAEVRDLTGLEAAENLQVITLRNNLITDLTPLSGLKKLRSVDLRGNRVNSLESLKDLPSLRELDLSQNKLKGLAGIEVLPSLRKLDVSENELQELTGISQLKNLGSLFAQGNKLGVSEPFDDQNGNGTFDLGETYKDISGNGAWDNATLSELDGLLHLHELYLYRNGISDVSKWGALPALQTLLLGVNEISDITSLKQYTALQTLSLNQNEVTDLGPLITLSSLIYLDLSENRLSDLRPLRNMVSLRKVYLNDNNLTDLRPMAGLRSLEILSINSNLVSDLRPMANLRKLKRLDAGRNLVELESDWNEPVIKALARHQVQLRHDGQGAMIEGLLELGEALIGDKAANSELGNYLLANGYSRLREYHADTKVDESAKSSAYRQWTKAIREHEIDQLPRLADL